VEAEHTFISGAVHQIQISLPGMRCLPGDNVISSVPRAVEIIAFKVEKDSKRNSNASGMKVAVEEKKS